MAHITGGGLTDNVPRILPAGMHASIRVGSWDVPELYRVLQERGEVSDEEMLRVFNMGVGMVLVVEPSGLREVLARLRDAGQKSFTIGTVQPGGSGVVYEMGAALSSDLPPTSKTCRERPEVDGRRPRRGPALRDAAATSWRCTGPWSAARFRPTSCA